MGAHRPEKVNAAAVRVTIHPPEATTSKDMVDMSSKAAQFDAMLALRNAQAEDPNEEERPPTHDTSPSTPAIITPGATQELFGSTSQGAGLDNIDPVLLAEEHQAHSSNNASNSVAASNENSENENENERSEDNTPDDNDDDETSNYGVEGEYQDLRQRLAMAKRLTAESVQELGLFVKADKKSREIRAFALALEIRDRLSHVEKNWTPSEDALMNIKEFSVACLLSTTSPSYKFGVSGIVMDTLKKSSIGLPEGWFNDAAKRGAVSSAVTKYLTWMRADMKKLIRTSINGTKDRPEDTQNIAQLADAIVSLGGPNTNATLTHWSRFAVMRSVYLKSDGPQFWDSVDEKMKEIREAANSRYPHDALKAKKEIHKAIENILHVDFKMWGNPAGSATREGGSSSNPIQRAVDNVAATRAGDITHRRANGQAHRKKHRVSRTQ